MDGVGLMFATTWQVPDPVMGAVFALASGAADVTTAHPASVATGMRMTFAVAAILVAVALAIAVGGGALATRISLPGNVSLKTGSRPRVP